MRKKKKMKKKKTIDKYEKIYLNVSIIVKV